MALPSRTNLEGEWLFNTKTDAETNILDGSANGEHLTATNTPTVVDGILGNALSFASASTEYLDRGNNTDFVFTQTDAFSLEAWVKSGTSAFMGIIAKCNAGANQTGYQIRFNGSGEIDFLIRQNTTNYIHQTTDNTYNDDEWHYVVATYDGSVTTGGMQIYVDGVAVAQTAASSGTITTIASTSNFEVGRLCAAGYPMDGEIDAVRVWSAELSAAEVTSLYNSGSGAEPQDWLSDDLPARVNVLGEWGMDEDSGTSLTDYSGNAHTGTLTNMEDADWIDGKIGNALYFNDGGTSNEYVDCGSFADFEYTDDFTMEAWTTIGSLAQTRIVTSKMLGSGTYRGYGIAFNSSHQIQFWLINDWGANNAIAGHTTTTYNDVEWHHVVLTYSGDASPDISNCTLYVDGKEVSITTDKNGLTGTISNASNVQISGRGGANYVMAGYVDTTRIYDTELTAAEVKALYNGGLGIATWGQTEPTEELEYTLNEDAGVTATDISGNNRDGTLINGLEWVRGRRDVGTDSKGDSDEYINVGNLLDFDYTDDFSLEAWFETTSANAQYIFCKRVMTGNYTGYFLYIPSGTSGDIAFGMYGGNGSKVRILTDNNGWNDGRWHHIVATNDGSSAAASSLNIYIDGVKKDVSAVNDNLNNTISTSQDLNIGANSSGTEGWQGMLDIVRIYEEELTHEQILEKYNEHLGVEGAAAPTPPAGGKAKKIGFGSKALNNRYTPIRK